MNARSGGLLFVLHTHLPWVLHHGRWPHGTDWLCEAVVDCYLPLLRVIEARARAGRTAGITLSLSPVLGDQLESPDFAAELRAFLVQRRRSAEEDARSFEHDGRAHEAALARRWAASHAASLEDWSREPDLVGRFARLAGTGAIELIPCGATHAELPLLASPVAVRRQVALAVESHRRRFGVAPLGMWLPECAYRPDGAWDSPVLPGLHEGLRPGLERILAAYGLDYFFVERHLVEGASPLAVFSAAARTRLPFAARSPRTVPPAGARPAADAGTPRADRAHRAGDSPVIVFARDAATSQQVWSRDGGYPGDPAYRDFHKRHEPGGHRYWAVTDPRGDLADKRLYDPAAAAERARVHAAHFLSGVAAHLARSPDTVVCAMYDTELFGHWWHEGPDFIAAMLDGAAAAGVRIVTAGEAAREAAGAPRVALREGTWGEGGGHDFWLNDGTRPMWRELHEVELAFEAVARRALGRPAGALDRWLAQALREVLLLEASDWPFLVTEGSAADYAASRAAAHARDARGLLAVAERMLDAGASDGAATTGDAGFLAACERRDGPFPWLDWRTGLREGDADRARSAGITAPAPAAPDPAWTSAIPGPDRPSRRGRESSASSSRPRAALHPPRGARGS